MRHKCDVRLFSGNGTERLFHLGGMAVAAGFVCRHAFVELGKMRVLCGFAAGAGYTGRAVGNYAVWGNEAAFEGRRERQGYRRGIAAGVSDKLASFYIFPEKLRKAVGGLFMQLWKNKFAVVPSAVIFLALEAEIGAHVYEKFPGTETFFGNFLRKAAWQRCKNNVAFFDDVFFIFTDFVTKAVISRIYAA